MYQTRWEGDCSLDWPGTVRTPRMCNFELENQDCLRQSKMGWSPHCTQTSRVGTRAFSPCPLVSAQVTRARGLCEKMLQTPRCNWKVKRFTMTLAVWLKAKSPFCPLPPWLYVCFRFSERDDVHTSSGRCNDLSELTGDTQTTWVQLLPSLRETNYPALPETESGPQM